MEDIQQLKQAAKDVLPLCYTRIHQWDPPTCDKCGEDLGDPHRDSCQVGTLERILRRLGVIRATDTVV